VEVTRYHQLKARRQEVLTSWAYAAKSRDYALAEKHAEHIEELDSEIYYEGGAPLSINEITAAYSAASIPWYNDVCAEYLEQIDRLENP